MNPKYPQKYQNLGHQGLVNKLENDPNYLTDKNLILFMAHDDFQTKPYNQAILKILSFIPTTKHNLIIFAEDLDQSFFNLDQDIQNLPEYNYSNLPQVRDLQQIDTFLTQFPNDPLIIACSAGVSRSGFVNFYLDLKHNQLSQVSKSYSKIDQEYNYFHSLKRYHPNTYYIHQLKPFLTATELTRLQNIPEKPFKLPVQSNLKF